jgi:threonine dehydrogenase-like Zn-dependent dehydrogenase
MTSMALWCVGHGQVALRPAQIGSGVQVTMLFSGISRGTERLVFEGRVPPSEYKRMSGPGQEGDFPFPVKYGYCAVGRLEDGPMAGRTAFALHPHQTSFCLPEASLNLLPPDLPPERAVLAANMETALNIMWDSQAGPGDTIVIIGAGVVGALTAYLAAKQPGTEVTLVDQNPERAALADSLGCAFADADNAPQSCDVVINASASAAGLETALGCAGQEARVVEASWHGEGAIPIPLGGAFHSKRLQLVSSQVGQIPQDRRARWSCSRRMSKALELLCDPALDILISGETDFNELPGVYGDILSDPSTLCHRIRYPQT